jgi:hypothetical protein|tara:strand:+ start:209 stop:346 length:138 start_codon:yes stop_codon:yes gene_type:complete
VKKLEDVTIPLQGQLRSHSISGLNENFTEIGGGVDEKYLKFADLR